MDGVQSGSFGGASCWVWCLAVVGGVPAGWFCSMIRVLLMHA